MKRRDFNKLTMAGMITTLFPNLSPGKEQAQIGSWVDKIFYQFPLSTQHYYSFEDKNGLVHSGYAGKINTNVRAAVKSNRGPEIRFDGDYISIPSCIEDWEKYEENHVDTLIAAGVDSNVLVYGSNETVSKNFQSSQFNKNVMLMNVRHRGTELEKDMLRLKNKVVFTNIDILGQLEKFNTLIPRGFKDIVLGLNDRRDGYVTVKSPDNKYGIAVLGTEFVTIGAVRE